MKLAVVGKWWSGKTTLSRLLTHYIAQTKSVVGIDSDHNMDYIDLMGLVYDDQTPTFKNHYNELFLFLEWEESQKKASKTIAENLGYHKFALHPQDDFSQKILISHGDNIHLGVVWLGSDDVMSSGMCAHGISNPLKVYLALLDEGESDVVVDGVAGVDMINFGLYHACDFLLIAVEPSRNGVKVAQQIQKLCDMSQVNYGFVINKYQENDYIHDFIKAADDKIIGHIPYDDGIFQYDYDQVTDTTKIAIQSIYEYCADHQWWSLVERMMRLEEIKKK